MSEIKTIDILLFCPNCAEQHIDEAQPNKCEKCGGSRQNCICDFFIEWLNPPHKSHRCHFCNHVWRPSDLPTNGVPSVKTEGKNDGNPRPRYFATAEDFSLALKHQK